MSDMISCSACGHMYSKHLDLELHPVCLMCGKPLVEAPLFRGGIPNHRFGQNMRNLRRIAGVQIDPARIAAAARILGQPIAAVDERGYEHEIVAAAPLGPHGELAYVTSTAKELADPDQRGGVVDVSFQFRVRQATGEEVASDLQSYNLFFGCYVWLLEWFGTTAVLIYREKHQTIIARCDGQGPALYRPIGDRWIITGNQLGYRTQGNQDTLIGRLSLPDLESLPALSEAEAASHGLCPPHDWPPRPPQ